MKRLCLAPLLLSLGCSTISVQRSAPLAAHARWVLLPIANQGEAPRAGERAEAILWALLRSEHRLDAASVPAEGGPLPELDDQVRLGRALRWARDGGYDYGLTGSVQEWRYRHGPDGEPAVGISLAVIDLRSGRTVWAATGARAGMERDTLSGTAHTLLRQLLARMELK